MRVIPIHVVIKVFLGEYMKEIDAFYVFKGKSINMISNSGNKGIQMDYSVIIHKS